MVGSPQLVKAWLEGDWNVIEGAFFNWDQHRHVVAPFTVPDDWSRFRSMDWGYASPNSVGWWAIVPDPYTARNLNGDNVILPRGCMVRYREWYSVAGRLTAEQIALGILDRETDLEKKLKLQGVVDPSAFKEDGGPSHGERMATAGVHFRPADNKRVSGRTDGSGPLGGWDQMRSRLNGDEQGRPMIVCFSTCTDSIRTIPVLQHDPDRPEDLDTEAEDHAADDWRYACMSRPYLPALPDKPKPKLHNDYVQRIISADEPEDMMVM